jgi:hypothetical protein
MQTSLYVHVNGLIRSSGRFVDDISAQYFKGIHRFTPTIARARFHDELITLGATPAADLSVLLLCMCLVAPDPESASDSASLQRLYLAAKSILAQLQGALATSIHLIQAGILLGICEYIQDEPNTALSTIASSARMAYAARIHHRALLSKPGADARDGLERLEARNTWWSVVIWERYVSKGVGHTVMCWAIPNVKTNDCVVLSC